MPIRQLLLLALIPGSALLSSLGISLIRSWAVRARVLAVPNQRSSHAAPVPLGAGLAFVLIVSIAWTACALALAVASLRQVLPCVAGGLLIGAVSWQDDRGHVPFGWRLTVHSLGAALAIAGFGLWHNLYLPAVGTLHLGDLGLPLTVLWIVGLVNAFNFIDGIDGMAGSQALIAGLGWTVIAWAAALPLPGALAALLAGCSLGFLRHNWPPARIFMGDAGSAFLGYSFAVLPLIAARGHPRLAVAGVLLVWPVIFDSTFTVIRRIRRHESIFTPHRSFLFHRLVISGLSHLSVAARYLTLSLAGVALGLAWSQDIPGARVAVLALLPGLCLVLWLFVLYQEQALAPRGHVQPPSFRRSVAALISEYVIPRVRRHGWVFARDAALVSAAYLAAEIARYNGPVPLQNLEALASALPLIVGVYAGATYLYAVHRRIWQYAGMYDVRSILNAALVSALVLTAIDLLVPGQQRLLPLSAIPVGGTFALGALIAVRLWTRLLHAPSPGRAPGPRVLMVGAGRTAQLVAADLLSDPDRSERPVAFLDDDPRKHDMRIHGLPVLGAIDLLPEIAAEYNIDIAIIAVPGASGDALDRILSMARQTGLHIHMVPNLTQLPAYQPATPAG